MKIPKKITPCPIVETIVEIRFESNMPQDAIFGMVYKPLQDIYPKLIKLPILQVPEVIREKDPNFKFKPYYQIRDEKFIFQIGPSVFSLNNKGEYVGWETYYPKIEEAFNIISKLDVADKVLRLGIRYINFFDFNIYDRINMQINIGEGQLGTEPTMLRAEIESNGYLNILQISNRTTMNIEGEKKDGSVIDIDTIHVLEEEDFFKNMSTILEKGHLEEKKLFFKLLRPDYLETLNPVY